MITGDITKNTSKSEIAINFIEKHLRIPSGKDYGKPLQLLDYQKDFIRDFIEPEYQDGNPVVRTGVLSIAKKNGKSFLCAALLILFAIHKDFGIRNGNLYLAANARDQAKIVFNDVLKFIRANPTLEAFFEITESTNTMRVIKGYTRGTVIKVLAADATTAQGLVPHISIYDEIGEGKNRALLDVLKMGLKSSDISRLVVISTVADDPNHHYSELIREAQNPDNPSIIGHIYQADADCDLMDKAQWHKANPALGKTINLNQFRLDMAEAARSPSMEASARRYALNQQIKLTDSLILTTDLKKCLPLNPPANRSESEDFKEGEKVWLGLDMSSKIDLTGLVAISESGLVKSWGFKPESLIDTHVKTDTMPYRRWFQDGWLIGTSGRSINPAYIGSVILDLHNRYELKALAYDRKFIDELFRLLNDQISLFKSGEEGSGLMVIPHSQAKGADMASAITALELGILNQELRFDGSPLLNSHLTNAQVKSDEYENRWFDKLNSKTRIDLAVAAAMAANIRQKDLAGQIKTKPEAVNPFDDPDFKLTTFGSFF